MEYLKEVGAFVTLALPYVCLVLIVCVAKFTVPSYFKEKGKGFATKQDIEGITNKVEAVKINYSMELERHKSGIWHEQQRQIWFREEFKVRLETFKRAVFLMNNYVDQIDLFQVCMASREVSALVAQLEIVSVKNKEFYRSEYESYRVKAEECYVRCKNIEFEMKELLALVEVYFESELSGFLEDLIRKGRAATDPQWTTVKFEQQLAKEINVCPDYSVACFRVRDKYLDEIQSMVPNSEAALCVNKLKAYILAVRKEVLEYSSSKN